MALQSFDHLPTWSWTVRRHQSRSPVIAKYQRMFSVRMGEGPQARVLYFPHPKQAVAHALRARRFLYGGAAGGGKSMWLRWHMIQSASPNPNFRALLLRRHRTDLINSQLIDIEQEVPEAIARYMKSQHRLVFPNGSLIQLGHCATEETFQRWLSSQWDMIGLDEASTFTPDMLVKLRSRLRTRFTERIRPQYVMASNPGGEGHWWLKSRFITKQVRREEDPTYDPADYIFLQAFVTDNDHINPEHAEELEALPPQLRAAYRYGDWDVFMGQYFLGLHTSLQGFRFPDEMPPGWRSWKKFRSYDWGYDKPACMLWWVVDPAGNPWCYRELYEPGIAVEEFMKIVVELSRDDVDDDGDFLYTVADPSCASKGSEDGPSIIERAAKAGVPMIAGGRGPQHARVKGWDLMRSYINPETKPLLHVAVNCEHWWRTVPSLVHDDLRPEDIDDEGEDHAADATRYFLMSRPAPTVFELVDGRNLNLFDPFSPAWHAKQQHVAARRAGIELLDPHFGAY